MAYKIDTVKDDEGRWRWMLDGGKVSSSDSFGNEADAVKAAREWIEICKALEAPPVAGPAVEVTARETAAKPKRARKRIGK